MPSSRRAHSSIHSTNGAPMTKRQESALELEADAPVSARIRQRIEQAGKRFHANDNIAEFIHDANELHALESEVSDKLQAVLESLVIDTRATTTRTALPAALRACSCRRRSKG